MSKLPPTCKGSGTQTDAAGSETICKACKRTQRTHPSGRLWTHRMPADCAALAYQRGRGGAMWPGKCSRKAIEGSRYCKQHAAMY